MKLEQLLESIEQGRHAPTERWNPPYCGELPIHIDADGNWFYQGSLIKRQALVKLFASVLVYEDKTFYLVTPAEKVKITVADAPFIVTTWQHVPNTEPPVIQLTTNIEQQFALSEQHPLIIKSDQLYVDCGRNLWAKVHRNVVYQWAEIARSRTQQGREIYSIESAGKQFDLNA
ncbi:DUF1285 domain-containing protein [Pseudidiomarina gelatinasegens]|jgi:hypothetical protein|uniref:DUF1285 domain-containing protein n=1 Tax=Pseudidiomarina gelatinasegens TaxID=2487740 RepID=UPI0030ECED67